MVAMSLEERACRRGAVPVITQTMNRSRAHRRQRASRGMPMYQTLKADIERDIREGRLLPGQRVPSESELIARYRVSSTTARRSLDELESEGLLDRRRGHGTFVSGMVGVLKKTCVAAVVKDIFSLAHPFLATVVGAIEAALEKSEGVRLVVVKAHLGKNGSSATSRLSDLLEHEGASHAFLLSNMPLRFVETAVDAGIKCVGVNTRYLDERIPNVCGDFEKNFVMALSALAERGHRRIAFLTREASMARRGVMNSSALLPGAYAKVREAFPALPQRPLVRQVRLEERIGDVLDALLSAHPRLTAFQCWDEMVGLEVVRHLQERGRQVPRQISVVGLRILPTSPLACTDIPVGDIGRLAAEMMLDWMNGQRPASHMVAPERFLVRETLGPAPSL